MKKPPHVPEPPGGPSPPSAGGHAAERLKEFLQGRLPAEEAEKEPAEKEKGKKKPEPAPKGPRGDDPGADNNAEH